MGTLDQEITLFFIASLVSIFFLLFVLLFSILAYNRKLLRAQRENFNRIIEATESETQRIGQNLHDDLGPLLASVKLCISGTMLGSTLEPQYSKMLTDGRDYVSHAMHTIRDLSHNLNAANFEGQSFLTILSNRINTLNQTGEWVGEIVGYEDEWEFQNIPKLMLFRICNELIYNSIKHSSGKFFSFHFRENKGNVQLIYSDDGSKEIRNLELNGIGMKGIHSRVKYLNGSMEIANQIGFKAEFTFPMSNLL